MSNKLQHRSPGCCLMACQHVMIAGLLSVQEPGHTANSSLDTPLDAPSCQSCTRDWPDTLLTLPKPGIRIACNAAHSSG